MKIKVSLKDITLEHEGSELQAEDIKVFDNKKVVISFVYFKSLEEIFKLVRAGLSDFKGNFEFTHNK